MVLPKLIAARQGTIDSDTVSREVGIQKAVQSPAYGIYRKGLYPVFGGHNPSWDQYARKCGDGVGNDEEEPADA